MVAAISDRAVVGRSHAMAILDGDLRHVRLASLLQLAEIEMYTAHIRLEDLGVISLRAGSVVAAYTAQLEGLAAVHELFLASEGRVRIELDDDVAGRPLAATIALVMDACRLVDEWQQMAGECWVLTSDMKLAPEHVRLLEPLRPVIAEMARGATLEVALTQLGRARAPLVAPLSTLIEAGVLVPIKSARPLLSVVTPPPLPADAFSRDEPPPQEPLDDAQIDELVTNARRLMRANQFEHAERLLRTALEQRPNDRAIAQNLRHLALRRDAA